MNTIYESMKPHEIFIYTYNGEIVDPFSTLKGAYLCLESALSTGEKLGLKSYSQLTRDMKISPLFNFIPKPMKVHQIRVYQLQKSFK